MKNNVNKPRTRPGRKRSTTQAVALLTGFGLTIGSLAWLVLQPVSASKTSDVVTRALVREQQVASASPLERQPVALLSAQKHGRMALGSLALKQVHFAIEEHGVKAAQVDTGALAATPDPQDLPVATASQKHDARQELVDKLGGRSDPDTRLQTARGIIALQGQPGADDKLVGMSLGVLAQLDPDSVVGTIEGLIQSAGEDSESARGVAQALGSVARHADVVSSGDLTAFYESGSRQVQLAAATALSSRGDDSLNQRLWVACAAELDHTDSRVRAGAVRDLAAQGSPELFELVAPLLEDDEEFVRLQSVRALERSVDPGVTERLRSLMADPAKDVRRAARRAVSRMELPIAGIR